MRNSGWRERYPLDEDFLAAAAAMLPSSGVALGLIGW
jgi:elongation factor P--beta-lysine ligase